MKFFNELLSESGNKSMTRFTLFYALIVATILELAYIIDKIIISQPLDVKEMVYLYVGIVGPFVVGKLFQKPMEK